MIVLVAVVVPQLPPLVVNVNMIEPVSAAPAVYVAFAGSPAFVHVPAPPDHVPPVAPPPTEPPIADEVPPWQIAVNAEPAFAVGLGLTVIVIVLEVAVEVVEQDASEVKTTEIMSPDTIEDVVYVDDIAPVISVPFNFHWYVGPVPPLIGVAVKVTLVPEQITSSKSEEEIDTDGVVDDITDKVDVTVQPAAK